MTKQGKANEYVERFSENSDKTWTDRDIQEALTLPENSDIDFCMWTNDMALLQLLDEQLFSKRSDIRLYFGRRWKREEGISSDFYEQACTALMAEFSKMKNVKKVRISLDKTSNIELIVQVTQLEKLSFDYPEKISIKFLEKMPNLKSLRLDGSYKDIETVGNCAKLEKLALEGNEAMGKLNKPELKDLSFITNLTQLQSFRFNIGKCSCDFSVLAQLPNLSYLLLANSKIENLDFIADCVSLETLILHRLAATQLPDLSKLKKLKALSLEQSKTISLQGLEKLTSLEYLQLDTMKMAKSKEIVELLKNLPALKMLQFEMLDKLQPLFEKAGIKIELWMPEDERHGYKPFVNRLNIY